MSEWIKTSERLPIYPENFLAFRNGHIYFMSRFLPDNLDSETLYFDAMYITGDINKVPYDDVTHWMPLPAPPES